MTGALTGVRVLDLAGGVAGGYCGKLLAELGADVVLVESPEGDVTRGLGPFPDAGADPEQSGLFLSLHAGKRGIIADLACEEDRNLVRTLLADADVLLTGRQPEELATRGLDPTSYQAAHPRLVHISITPYGVTGPYRTWKGDEITSYAMGGFLQFGGEPDREPLTVPGYQAEHHAGMHGALAALVALSERDRSGLGQFVDVSAVESMLSAHSWTTVAWSHSGQRMDRTPTDLIPCADGWVFFMLTNLEGLAVLIERPDLLDDPRFATPLDRLQNRVALQEIVAAWCLPHTMEEIYRAGQELRVAVTPVYTVAELASYPQLAARDWFRTLTRPNTPPLRTPGPPYRLSATPATLTRPAPTLGEHTAELKAEGWYRVPDTQPTAPPSTSAQTPASAPGAAPPSSLIPHPSSPAAQPLASLRVLELTANWAGPLAGRYLADLGAEVIKVESPRRPATRGLHYAGGDPRTRGYNRAGYFNKLNRNKLGLTLDLSNPRGRELFLCLIERADVFIENNSARVLGNLGLDYDVLRQHKPDIILCSMSGFGATGPERDYVAYGSNIETVCGLASLMTYPNDPTPHRTGSYYADPVAGAHGAIAILAALRHRDRTGEGQFIDMSLLESAAALFSEALTSYALTGRAPEPRGNRHAVYAPQGVYRAAGNDSWLALSVRDEQEWRALCHTLGKPELAEEPRWGNHDGRHAAHDEIDALISAWSRTLDHYDAARALQQAGVPAAPVMANWELLSDPHLFARGFYVPVPHPEVGVLPFPGFPWHFSRTPGAIRSGAPCFAEHNDTVLRDILNLTDTEVAELYEQEITSDAPLVGLAL
jgi:crotonobetainyl-CoA:carnitine CoA-transferase CaiB-like acyl-CoA transferase